MRYLLIVFVLALGVVWGVGELFPGHSGYASVASRMVTATTEPLMVQPTADVFPRGSTVLQGQPCDDQRGGVNYRSDILSREEVLHELKNVGFSGQMLEDMAAVTLAESGRQLSCVADEHLVDGKWDVSYGVYAIRALKAEEGKGTCRDILRLKRDDFRDQTLCAWEISGYGRTLQPWSVTHVGRGKPFLKYIGK